jgi:cell division septation protein DedD
MPEKNKKDLDLIKSLFKIEPIDWARRADGCLVFISPTGQKFVYTDEMITAIQETLKANQPAPARPPAKPAAAAKSAPKPEAKPKAEKK